ncbi:hypothetical protein [Rhodococcus gordoniae]
MVNVHTLVAVGASADGYDYGRILGVEVTSAEDGTGWLGDCPGCSR